MSFDFTAVSSSRTRGLICVDEIALLYQYFSYDSPFKVLDLLILAGCNKGSRGDYRACQRSKESPCAKTQMPKVNRIKNPNKRLGSRAFLGTPSAPTVDARTSVYH